MTASNQIYSGGILLKADAGINLKQQQRLPPTTPSPRQSRMSTTRLRLPSLRLQRQRHPAAPGGEHLPWCHGAEHRWNNYSGSVTILDFTAATAPQDDILYNNVPTPGALSLFGGSCPQRAQAARCAWRDTHPALWKHHRGRHAVLPRNAGGHGWSHECLRGHHHPERRHRSHRFHAWRGRQHHLPGMAEGFVGPFAAYASSTGQRSWARVSGGVLSAGYLGDTAYGTGSSLALTPSRRRPTWA